MKVKYMAVALMGAMVIVSCKNDAKEKEVEKEKVEVKKKEVEVEKTNKVTLTLEPKSGSKASGSAVFKEENGQVKMTVAIGGLSKGTHAIHLHEKADCSSDDGKSTGGHWNPTAQPHGKWGDAAGYHKGDIGNFEVNDTGNGSISFTTDQWCIGCDDETKNIIGKAVIVHQGTDDMVSQPSGAAGARVSCGGVIK